MVLIMNARKLYLFIVGMQNLSYSTAFTIFAIYLVRDIGVNPLQLVLPGTAFEIMIFLFEVPTGVVADIYSRRLSVIVGYALIGLGMIVSASIPMFEMVVIGMMLAGIGSTFISGALSAWLVDEIGQDEASQAFVRGAQLRLIGQFLGIILSMVLGSISLPLAIVASGVMLVALSIVLIFIMPETGFQRLSSSESESWRDLFTTLREGVTFVRASHILFWILVVTFIAGGFGEGYGRLWQIHILGNFSLPPLGDFDDIIWFGIINGVFMPVTLAAMEFIHRRVDLTDNQAVVRILTIVFGLMIVSVLAVALSNIFALTLLGLWITQMLRSMSKPLMEAWTNQHIESNVRATILSIQGQVNSLGEVVGGPVIGFVGTISSIRIALVLSTLILSPLIAVFNRTLKQES